MRSRAIRSRAIRSVDSKALRRLATAALAVTFAVLMISGEAQAVCADEAVSDMASGDLTGLLALFAGTLAVFGFLGLARKFRSNEPLPAPPEPVPTAPAH